MEPSEFLRHHPPFDRLTSEEFRQVEQNLEVAYLPAGSRVLERGGPRSEHLWLVRKGAVELQREGQQVQALEEGDSFGFPSLISRSSPLVDVVATEDTLAYRIPGAVFDRLMRSPDFAQFFLHDLGRRLREQAEREPLPVGRDLATPVGRLAPRQPLRMAASTSLGEAARSMLGAGVDALLVEDDPLGIVTDRDLRRGLAEGRGPEEPLSSVVRRPVYTLPAEASLFEALAFMLEHGVHHAPLESEGSIVGLVSDADLLRLQARNPLYLLREIENLAEPGVFSGYALELAGMVEGLAWAGLEAAQVGRVVSSLNDALIGRLLRLAEARLGEPPTPYAWIVFGSEGRMEQALLTDQDNALVYQDDTPQARQYFAALSERVVDSLLAASFPRCAGGFMATHWHRPIAEWLRLFRGWLETPEPQALMEAANFFDFRALHGTLSLEPLQDVLRLAGRTPVFLAHLARATLGMRPPLGLFRQLREDQPGGVDLKKGGILPIVGLARLYALAAGSDARPTLRRLEVAAIGGTLSRDGAATLAEAFRFLLRLRLRTQLRTLRAGGQPGNVVPLEDLSSLERRHLKETFLVIRELQEATALRFATERLG